jgi:hypothetical protein
MHWSGERDRLTGEQVALLKRELAWMADEQLLESYAVCVRGLALYGGYRRRRRRCSITSSAGGNCGGARK